MSRWDDSGSFQPFLQIIDLTLLEGSSTPRHHVLLSDGIYYMQVMLASQLNQRVDDGTLRLHAIVRITEAIVSQVQGRKIAIVSAN